MVLKLPEPVLKLSFNNFEKLSNANCDEISAIWNIFTKCKDNLENGHRLENLSWRLWYKSTLGTSNHHQYTIDSSIILKDNTKIYTTDSSADNTKIYTTDSSADNTKNYNHAPAAAIATSIRRSCVKNDLTRMADTLSNDIPPIGWKKATVNQSLLAKNDLPSIHDSTVHDIQDSTVHSNYLHAGKEKNSTELNNSKKLISSSTASPNAAAVLSSTIPSGIAKTNTTIMNVEKIPSGMANLSNNTMNSKKGKQTAVPQDRNGNAFCPPLYQKPALHENDQHLPLHQQKKQPSLYINGHQEKAQPLPFYQLQQEKAQQALLLSRQQQYQQYMIQQHILQQQQLCQQQKLRQLAGPATELGMNQSSGANQSSGSNQLNNMNEKNMVNQSHSKLENQSQQMKSGDQSNHRANTESPNAGPSNPTTTFCISKLSGKPKFFISDRDGEGNIGNNSNSETSTLSYSGPSDGSPDQIRRPSRNEGMNPNEQVSNYDSGSDYFDSDSEMSYGSDEEEEENEEYESNRTSSSLDTSKSLFTKQKLPIKRPSLLSVALQRTAFRKSQTALSGLATTSGAPINQVNILTPSQQIRQIQEMVCSELTPSIRETLMSDHARPFGTVVTCGMTFSEKGKLVDTGGVFGGVFGGVGVVGGVGGVEDGKEREDGDEVAIW